MVRGIEGNEMSTPRPKSSSQAATTQSSKQQKTILGFFQKKAAPSPSTPTQEASKAPASSLPTPSSSIEIPGGSSPPSLTSTIRTGGNKENGSSPMVSSIVQELTLVLKKALIPSPRVLPER